MTLLPKIKLKTLPTFPSNIIGGTGIDATKINGAVTVDMDWSEFGTLSALPVSPTNNFLTFDPATSQYVMVPSHLFGGGVSGISDAPTGGLTYGRKSGNWVAVPSEAPSDGTLYGRQSGAWVSIPITSATDYPTKIAVQSTVIPGTSSYLRTAGYSIVGDGGAALYKRVASQPTHQGKIQSSDGAWWEIAETVLHTAMFGVVADGSTDNATSLQNAFSTLTALGGVLILSRGTIKSSTAITINIPNNFGIRVIGEGQDASVLHFPFSVSALVFNYAGPYSSVNLSNFSVVASSSGGATAVTLSCSSFIGNPANTALTTISNITTRGADGYEGSAYWNVHWSISNVSNVNFLNCMMVGPGAGGGNGIILAGLPGSGGYGVAYNITGCFFNALGIGLYYGSYVQGVTVSQCNFTGGTTGVYTNGSGQLQQFSVVECQFGGILVPFNLSTVVGEFYACGNLISVQPSSNGIQGQPVNFTILGNTFQGGAPSANNGVYLTGGGIGVITGNSFAGLTNGVNISAGVVVQVNVQSNFYSSVTSQTIPATSGGSITVGGGSK